MKTYEIIFSIEDMIDDNGDFTLWLRTDHEVKLPGEVNGDPSIKEIDITPSSAGIDIIVE